MVQPEQILALAHSQAAQAGEQTLLADENIIAQVEFVCRNLQNRAGARLLLALLLAKTHRPEVDIRKPYTEIGTPDSYSGRSYDESYVTAFISAHRLPCNPTTAFLTPALRNRNSVLTPDVDLVGRPPILYQTVLRLLDAVYRGAVESEDLLAETIRWLLIVRDEREQRTRTLLAGLQSSGDNLPLSVETIIRLIEQHLQQPRASRLPVLMVAAAYEAVAALIGEQARKLYAHNAADSQTGTLGDLEITLTSDEAVVTSYEMKTRPISQEDVEQALQKVLRSPGHVQHYVFITTAPIAPDVQKYAQLLYEHTQGTEFVILDCIGFLRHFLHFFHRLRMPFVEAYQRLLLAEPESGVSQPLKEVWLALRQATESDGMG